jgi:hypothetical protein
MGKGVVSRRALWPRLLVVFSSIALADDPVNWEAVRTLINGLARAS